MVRVGVMFQLSGSHDRLFASLAGALQLGLISLMRAGVEIMSFYLRGLSRLSPRITAGDDSVMVQRVHGLFEGGELMVLSNG